MSPSDVGLILKCLNFKEQGDPKFPAALEGDDFINSEVDIKVRFNSKYYRFKGTLADLDSKWPELESLLDEIEEREPIVSGPII